MIETPEDLLYSDDHHWIREERQGTVTIGLTDYFQRSLGEMVFIELPEMEAELQAGDDAGIVESVESARDLYAPLTGKVIDINPALEDSPGLLNSDPYGEGWLYRLKLEDADELEDLMTSDVYQETLEEELDLEEEDD